MNELKKQRSQELETAVSAAQRIIASATILKIAVDVLTIRQGANKAVDCEYEL